MKYLDTAAADDPRFTEVCSTRVYREDWTGLELDTSRHV